MIRELDESMETLNELHGTLPTIQSHVSDIRVVYDSGREKVRSCPELGWPLVVLTFFYLVRIGANTCLRFNLAKHRIL